jgi:hypothetical protein
MDETSGSELQMSAAEMRDAGYRTVDMLVRELTDTAAPPLQRGTAPQMRELLGGAPPEDPTPFADVLAVLERDVLPYRARGDHPGFFAFISYCGTWPGALGDFIASAANIYASTWLESAGPSQVELEVLDWFKDWIGYPQTAEGILLSGGSAANMTALACARESLVGPMSDDLVAYVADQAHSSVARAARILGLTVRLVVQPAGHHDLPAAKTLQLLSRKVLVMRAQVFADLCDQPARGILLLARRCEHDVRVAIGFALDLHDHPFDTRRLVG